MNEARRFSLDTNVLIYPFSSREPAKAARARTIIHAALTGDCILTVQALGEFFHATTRKRLLTPDVASDQVANWVAAFRVEAAGVDDIQSALRLHGRMHLAFWDALLLATLHEAGCTVLLSEDLQHGADYDGVRVLNPFRGGQLDPEIAALLDPD